VSAKVLKTAKSPELPRNQMSDKLLAQFCEMGQKADEALKGGRTKEALLAYQNIIKKVEDSGELDSYLLAKVTLGALRAHTKLANFKEAIDIWNAHMDESLWGIGIYALENAQTRIEDLVVYDMLCAFLHTMIDGSRDQSAKAVNLYMSRVCEYAEETGERALMVQALANWKAHLKEIYQGSIPQPVAAELIHFERAFGETVKPRQIDFPLPSAWERPSSFRETSTVVSKKSLTSRGKKR